MWALAEGHDDNKQVLAEAGAIPALVTQLSTVVKTHEGAPASASAGAAGTGKDGARSSASSLAALSLATLAADLHCSCRSGSGSTGGVA